MNTRIVCLRTPRRHFFSGLPVCLLATTLSVVAQTAAPTPAPASSAAPDEVLTLPDFSVTASAQSEYVAAESLTGTRVASKIRDLPFTVNVITSEFMDDFSTFEFGEQTAFTSGVVAFETISTGYSVRGIDANVQLRNGFRRIGLIDKVNVDRIEVIKGAAASIYGTVMPGGTVNVITKKPRAKREDSITASFGSNDLMRGQVSSTGPLGQSGKLFYRLDLAAQSTDYDIADKHMEQWTVVPQLLWKPNRDTSFSLEYEYLERSEEGMATVPNVRAFRTDPYRTGGRTFLAYDRMATEIFDFNFSGPDVIADRYVHTVTLTFEHRINDTFSLRSSANWFERGLVRDEFAGRDYDPLTNSVRITAPRHRPFPEGGGSWQTDLLASWKTGSVSHKTLLTVDYQRQTEKPERWDSRTSASADGFTPGLRINGSSRNVPIAFPGAVAAITALPITSGTHRLVGPIGSTWLYGEIPVVIDYDNNLGMPIDNPNYDYLTYDEDTSVYSLRQWEDNSIDIYGVFLSHRSTFFQNRATILGGIRYDYVDGHSRNNLSGTDRERQTDATSYQIGANFRVVQPVTAYANISRSFVPDFSTGTDEDFNTFDPPNEIGTTKEIGLKAALFAERLTFTAAYFDIERKNVRRTGQRDDGSTYDIVNGGETSKGFEIDYNWVVLPQKLQFFGQYSYIDSEIRNAAATPGFEGGPTRRTPRDRFSIGLKLTPREGLLKNFAFTAGYRYEGESRGVGAGARRFRPADVTAANPFVNNPLPSGALPVPSQPAGAILTSIDDVVFLPDGREAIYNPAYELFQAGVGYSWRDRYRNRHKLQLNVTNILDERYTYGSNGQGAGRNWVVTYDLHF